MRYDKVADRYRRKCWLTDHAIDGECAPPDGHIKDRIEFWSEDDEKAKDQAERDPLRAYLTIEPFRKHKLDVAGETVWPKD